MRDTHILYYINSGTVKTIEINNFARPGKLIIRATNYNKNNK